MKTISLHVDDIEIGERHRALSDDAVQRLAGSMKDIGLKQPISVRVVDEMMVDGHLTSGVPVLVVGRHRLAAAKSLGWSHIDCIEVEDDEIQAELWEIAENLHRLDLTKEQRDDHIRRYAELLEARREAAKAIDGQNVQQLAAAPVGRPKSVATEVADATGLSARTVRRALAPQVIPMPQPALDPEDAFNRWAGQMNRLWGSASAEWRERWETERDAPIMDQRYG